MKYLKNEGATLKRSIEILQLIPSGSNKNITAKRIHDILDGDGHDVNIRMIQRDLIKLSSIYPLVSDEKNPLGWSWVGGATKRLPAMGTSTALAFVMTERFLSKLMPVSVLKKLEPDFNHAKQSLKGLKRRLGKWEDKVRIIPRGFQLLPAQIKPEALDVVYESLLGEVRFEANYQAANTAEISKYEVNPLAIVHRNNISYLVCTLWDYSDIKQLAMHRFQKCKALDKDTTVPKEFDIDDYIRAGEFSYPDSDKKIKIKLFFEKMAGKHLYQTAMSDDQSITEISDGRLVVKATVLDTEELRWWILGFGDYVEVASPKKLRQDISRSLRAAADLYR